jgi:hypothetical protein
LQTTRPGERNNNAYEGLGPIARFAQRGRGLLSEDGLLLLNISTLAGERPLAWFDEHRSRLDVLDRMRGPLKVNAVTSGSTPEAGLVRLPERPQRHPRRRTGRLPALARTAHVRLLPRTLARTSAS